jgi:hypothetical protein
VSRLSLRASGKIGDRALDCGEGHPLGVPQHRCHQAFPAAARHGDVTVIVIDDPFAADFSSRIVGNAATAAFTKKTLGRVCYRGVPQKALGVMMTSGLRQRRNACRRRL